SCPAYGRNMRALLESDTSSPNTSLKEVAVRTLRECGCALDVEVFSELMVELLWSGGPRLAWRHVSPLHLTPDDDRPAFLQWVSDDICNFESHKWSSMRYILK